MTPTFFATPEDFRAWLAAHHDTERELLVGFHKVGSGRPSITWPQSVDQALSFGWIDGVRRRIDDDSYSIRFTPRKPRSTWSAVNIKRMGELAEAGLVHAAGAAAFEARAEDRSGIYAYEQRGTVELSPEYEAQFRADGNAWAYFQARPAWYRKTALWRVMSAKKEETRAKRLASLIEHSAAGRPVPELDRDPRPK
ncbi:MAG: hypothetical protein JWM27_121 [Gemmatimonadetes bacterium]|nr:hypothetical protein [Gemmatimonadota bacterium]